MSIASTGTANLSIDEKKIIPIECFDPAKPYNALPPLPPKADLESRTVLSDCIGARATLAELEQAGDLLSNQPKVY